MSERCYYKVEDSQSSLHKKCCEFLDMERELTEKQKRTIEEKLPKFSKFKGARAFTRIVRYEGFVFDDQEHIDAKVWKTKEQDGYMLSTPNRRTKAGREMEKFLANFKRTDCWDVDRILDIDKTSIYGSFYPANLFRHNDCIYIIIDSQFKDVFEQNNPEVIEITLGEINKAIDAYNQSIKNMTTE